MPSKYPILKPGEVIKALRTAGFQEVSQKGSHKKLSDGEHVVIIPMHDEVARGTLRKILEQAGMDLEGFLKLL